MTNGGRVDRLAHILEEHECWEHPGWREMGPRGYDADRSRIVHEIADPEPTGSDKCWASLRDAIREVESGAIFGSPERCCVCGSDTEGGLPRRVRRYRMFQAEHAFFAHRGCSLLIEVAADQLRNSKPWSREKEIIRARRLHRWKEKTSPTCANCGDLSCTGRGEDGNGPHPRHCWCQDGSWPKPPRVSETWGMSCPGFCDKQGFVNAGCHSATLFNWHGRLEGIGVKAIVPAGCAQPWPKPPQPSEEMVERVANVLDLWFPQVPSIDGERYRKRAIHDAARAAIREVLR